MAEAKTQATKASVSRFLAKVTDPSRRADCETVVQLMREATGEEPVMWGPSIVGFGRYRYEYASGRTGEWPLLGFSPRKGDLTLYLMPEVLHSAAAEKLGPHRKGKSCLYLKRLADVDQNVLRRLLATSLERMAPQRVHPA